MPLPRSLIYAALPVCTFAALYFIDRASDSQVVAAAPIARSIDPFLSVQNTVFDRIASLHQAENVDLPLPNISILADDCVVSITSKAWARFGDMQAEIDKQYRKIAEQLASGSGKPPPAFEPVAPKEEDVLLLIESVNRFDLRAFDLTEFTPKEQDGVFAAMIKALPYEGGGDPTNLRFIEAWAATSDSEERKEAIREFGEKGRVKYRLANGGPPDPSWINQRDTFMALREALLNAEDATNITMATSYKVTEDGTHSEYNGLLAQPKAMTVYASSQDELQEQIDLLREWKTEQGCE